MKFSLIKIFLTMFIANTMLLISVNLVSLYFWTHYGDGWADVLRFREDTIKPFIAIESLPFIFLGGAILGFLLIMITRRIRTLDKAKALYCGVAGFILSIVLLPIWGYIDYTRWGLRYYGDPPYPTIGLPKPQGSLYYTFSEFYSSRFLHLGTLAYILGFALGAWGLYTLLKSSGDGRKAKEKNQFD